MSSKSLKVRKIIRTLACLIRMAVEVQLQQSVCAASQTDVCNDALKFWIYKLA